MTDKEWTPREIATLKLLWVSGEKATNIGRQLGRSKNSIIGKVGRLKLHRSKDRQREINELRNQGKLMAPPKDLIPAEQVIQDMLDEQYPTESSHHPEMSLIAAGALIDTIDPKQIASASGRSIPLAVKVQTAMVKSKLWGTDAGDITRYDGAEGWMQLLLEAMMTKGEITYKDGAWLPARTTKPKG